MRHRVAWMVLVLGVASGCGSGDDAAPAAGTDVGDACEELLGIRLALLDHASPTYLQDLEGFADRWESFADAVGEGPIASAASSTAQQIRDAVASSDVGALYSPESAAVEGQIDEWAAGACGFAQIDVALSDGSLAVASPPASGPVVFHVTNGGAVGHQLTVNRIRDEVTETPEEVLASPGFEELLAKIEVVNSGGIVPPGGAAFLVSELRPGRYLLVDPSSEAGGAPAFVDGVWASIVVD